MNLETIRLKILELTEQDHHDIHKKNLIIEVAEFNTIGIPGSITETEARIARVIKDKLNEERVKYGWAVRIKESNVLIGNRNEFI